MFQSCIRDLSISLYRMEIWCKNLNKTDTIITYWFYFLNELLLICLQLTIFLDSRIYSFTRWQCCIRDKNTIIHNWIDSLLFQTSLSFELTREKCLHFVVRFRIKMWLICLALSMDRAFRHLHTRGPMRAFVSCSISLIMSRLSIVRSRMFGSQDT
jgi:hypothetical protein